MKGKHYHTVPAFHSPFREPEETHNPKEIYPSPFCQTPEMKPVSNSWFFLVLNAGLRTFIILFEQSIAHVALFFETRESVGWSGK